jgi:hypothetical protein
MGEIATVLIEGQWETTKTLNQGEEGMAYQ